MLHKSETLRGYTLSGLDGEMGKVKEFYFDDQHWVVRYLVAETGNWLSDRQVLISPHALTAVNLDELTIAVNLTKKQIEGSPSLNTDKPVSRQYEVEYYGYYGWPIYWGGMPYPYLMPSLEKGNGPAKEEHKGDPHLRSTQRVIGNYVQATDGSIGHIADFMIDDQTWAIRYLIVDTRNWWPGKKVLVSPAWIERISGPETKVYVNLSRSQIKESPEYTDDFQITRDYENKLHQHYDRKGYWVDEPDDKSKSN
jgi:hypothetical protein